VQKNYKKGKKGFADCKNNIQTRTDKIVGEEHRIHFLVKQYT